MEPNLLEFLLNNFRLAGNGQNRKLCNGKSLLATLAKSARARAFELIAQRQTPHGEQAIINQ